MTDTQKLLTETYAAFNARDIDRALAVMSEQVSWPKASEGGRVEGKEEIRAYWTRQWQEFDPHVEPVGFEELGGGRTAVRVHQVVRSLEGEMLSDSEVRHVYTLADGLIERMEMGEDGADSQAGPSAAFLRQD